ncbi:MAG: hypothetical protein ACI9JY_001682 [Saprospiraceae bacterium]|jgi:hypothetical protein
MKYPITLIAIVLFFASFTLLPSQKNTLNNTLTLTASTKTANPGGEICIDVTTRDFNQILSMQYTMKWNTKALRFKELRKFGLAGLTAQNFGQNSADKGILAFSWYDQNLRSVTMPDGSSLYQVCFDVIGQSGDKSYIQFTGSPTAVEISNADGGLLELNGVTGVVKIR